MTDKTAKIDIDERVFSYVLEAILSTMPGPLNIWDANDFITMHTIALSKDVHALIDKYLSEIDEEAHVFAYKDKSP